MDASQKDTAPSVLSGRLERLAASRDKKRRRSEAQSSALLQRHIRAGTATAGRIDSATPGASGAHLEGPAVEAGLPAHTGTEQPGLLPPSGGGGMRPRSATWAGAMRMARA